jgi:predicted acyltransferase
MNRLQSLDVFRGLTVALMITVNNPGDWGAVYAPLLHAEWHGCTPTDLVFPFFLFAVGVSIVFSMAEAKHSQGQFSKILLRSLKLFALGLFLNLYSKIDLGIEGLPNFYPRFIICLGFTVAMLGNWSTRFQQRFTIGFLVLAFGLMFFKVGGFATARIPGVLQRISLVYFASAWLFMNMRLRTQLITFIGILLGYWALMVLVPVPGVGAANVESGRNLAAWLDSIFLENHCWATTKTWDPEGLLSTLPAIATGLAGVFAGTWLKSKNSSTVLMQGLFLAGAVAAVWGLVLDFFFPINKSLWTSSYVLFTAGLGSILLGGLYWLIDIKQLSQKFYLFFLVYGVNAIAVFFGSGLIPRLLNDIKFDGKGLKTLIYENAILPAFTEKINASLAAALIFVFIWFLILWQMWRKKVFVKV